VSDVHTIKVDQGAVLVGPCNYRREGEGSTRELLQGETIKGIIFEYAGNNLYRLMPEGDEFAYLEAGVADFVPDTPEYRLAGLVFGREDVIDMPPAPKPVKSIEERDGRCAPAAQSALIVLTQSPHTRAVLAIIDPQGLKQADAALELEGWTEGSEWPDKELSTRQTAIKGIGKKLKALGVKFMNASMAKDNPSSHKGYEALRAAGISDEAISEYARISAGAASMKRLAMAEVASTLGISQSELFQAEENAAD